MAKKKSNGEGHIRQRANGTWEAQLSLGSSRKSIYGKTKAEVRKKMTALQAQYDAGEYVKPSQITVAEWAEIWLTDYMMGKRESTVRQYTIYMRKRVLPALGTIRLMNLDTPRIQHLYTTLIKEVKPKTVRNIHGILHEMLEKAVKVGYLKVNPSNACELPKVQQEEMFPIVDEHLTQFLAAIEHHRYGALYYVTMFTGMREAEAIGLTWDCVDFERGIIRLYRQLHKVVGGGGTYVFGPLKSKQSRVIEPAPQVMARLKKVKAEQAAWKLKCGELWNNPHDLVFTHEDGSNLKVESIYGCFKRIVTKLGIPRTRFHDLRHTFVTLSLQNGTDIKTVSESAGHATVAFTMDKYGHKLLFRGRFHLPATKRLKTVANQAVMA